MISLDDCKNTWKHAREMVLPLMFYILDVYMKSCKNYRFPFFKEYINNTILFLFLFVFCFLFYFC